jgi:hypothetical protein
MEDARRSHTRGAGEEERGERGRLFLTEEQFGPVWSVSACVVCGSLGEPIVPSLAQSAPISAPADDLPNWRNTAHVQ